MLVTLDVLRKYGACEQWRKIFAYRFPKGLNIETRDDFIDALILGGMHPVAKWVVTLGIFDKIDLGRADLSRADLSGADLSGADLSGAGLDGADLSDVRGVKSAQLALAKNLDAAFPAALVEKESAELSAQTS